MTEGNTRNDVVITRLQYEFLLEGALTLHELAKMDRPEINMAIDRVDKDEIQHKIELSRSQYLNPVV